MRLELRRTPCAAGSHVPQDKSSPGRDIQTNTMLGGFRGLLKRAARCGVDGRRRVRPKPQRSCPEDRDRPPIRTQLNIRISYFPAGDVTRCAKYGANSEKRLTLSPIWYIRM